MDYSASEFNENQMSLEYEAVKYTTGNVSYGSPKGFATLHYDSIPSPLSVAGGGVSTLTGEGGVLDGIQQIFGDIGSGGAFSSPGGFLGTVAKSINTYKNFQGLSIDQLKTEAVNILSNPGTIQAGISTVGGIVGAVFPKSNRTETTTTAQSRPVIARAAFTNAPVTAPGQD